MKVLICGDQTEQLVQEIDTYDDGCSDLIPYPLTLEKVKTMSLEQLILFPIVIFVFNTDQVIETAKWINRMNPVCQLIFVGEDYGDLSRVYETKHTYFMLMDHVSVELKKAIRCALRNYDSICGDTLIPLYCKGIKHFILPEDIVYAEVWGRILSIHTVQGIVYKTNSSLKKFCERLPSWFIRTHNSYVVNKKQVFALDYPECILRNGERIPVSRHYRRVVDQRMEKV